MSSNLDQWELKKVKKRIQYLEVLRVDQLKEIENVEKKIKSLSLIVKETINELERLKGEINVK